MVVDLSSTNNYPCRGVIWKVQAIKCSLSPLSSNFIKAEVTRCIGGAVWRRNIVIICYAISYEELSRRTTTHCKRIMHNDLRDEVGRIDRLLHHARIFMRSSIVCHSIPRIQYGICCAVLCRTHNESSST